MNANLPKKCFISHAYADIEHRERLLASLPEDVESQVFPPITVPPDEFVSNELIQTLTECDALIYLKGGASDYSFWVAFERDFALRLGKQVFSADVKNDEINPHIGGQLDLATFASYHHQDSEHVRKVSEFLKNNRYFDLWLDIEKLKGGDDFKEAIELSIEDRINRGGYVVVFWSRSASESQWIQREIQIATEGTKDWNDRVLLALLEEVELPEYWRKLHEPAVQLYSDEERSATQRIDDLVVRLYWLIYRKTEQRNLD